MRDQFFPHCPTVDTPWLCPVSEITYAAWLDLLYLFCNTFARVLLDERRSRQAAMRTWLPTLNDWFRGRRNTQWNTEYRNILSLHYRNIEGWRMKFRKMDSVGRAWRRVLTFFWMTKGSLQKRRQVLYKNHQIKMVIFQYDEMHCRRASR